MLICDRGGFSYHFRLTVFTLCAKLTGCSYLTGRCENGTNHLILLKNVNKHISQKSNYSFDYGEWCHEQSDNHFPIRADSPQ